jgi:L,D-transpeptidase-like protein/putative peptidoglycan binding protein
MARGRHAPRRRIRGFAIVGIVVAFVTVTAAAGAYAAYRYEQMRADRILPGVTIEGLDVSNMTAAQATKAVKVLVGRRLDHTLTIRSGDDAWRTTLRDLGRHAFVRDAVDQALAVSAQLGTFDRFWHRFRDESVDVDVDLAYSAGALPGLDDLVTRIARREAVAPRNASIGLDADRTDVTFIQAKDGVALPTHRATNAIVGALDAGRDRVRLTLRSVPADITEANLGPTIVVHVDRNRLELYDGFRVEQTWEVATAKPGYTTPAGVWTIWDKRENPTWYNPALDSWGAGLPAVVPGGPGNPMGTRAIYIDAPGLIRIHGTPDPSSVGRYASHGCIRMRNEEVEDLFDRIPIGAHVVIAGSRPADASYWDTPGNADI